MARPRKCCCHTTAAWQPITPRPAHVHDFSDFFACFPLTFQSVMSRPCSAWQQWLLAGCSRGPHWSYPGTAITDPGAMSVPPGAGSGLIPRRIALLADRKADQASRKEQQAGNGEGEVIGAREVAQSAAELNTQRPPDLVPREGEAVEDAEVLQAIDLRCERTGQGERGPPGKAHDHDKAPQAPGARGQQECGVGAAPQGVDEPEQVLAPTAIR